MPMNRMKKYGIIGISLFFFSFIFRYIILPPIIRSQIKKQTELRPGKFMRGIWGKFPFTFDYNFFIYNVSNPDGITNGEKPILQEVGPFVYDEWQEKVNQVDHEEDDTVSFSFKSTYIFNAEKSKGLTGEEEVIVPNYFILGLVNTLLYEKPSVIPLAGKGVDSIFKKPSSIFMKIKVKDILFDGFIINCTVSDFAGAAVCNELKNQYEVLRLKKIEEDVYRMSLWGSLNATESNPKLRVFRGNKNLMDLAQVVEYANKPNISTWNDPRCDNFNGTDGTIFHPYYRETDYIGLFHEGLCRNIPLEFVSRSKFAGLKTFKYTANIGVDPVKNAHEKCYCLDPNNCLKSGVYDGYKCVHVPLIFSSPHFYSVDPFYLNTVEGLSPDQEKHMLYVEIEPLTGVPVHAHSRAQLNMFIQKIEKIKIMKNLPDALLPLLWFDQVLVLPDFLIKEIKDGHRLIAMAKMFYYLMMFSGLGMSIYTGIKYYRSNHRKNNNDIKKTVQSKNDITRPNSAENKAPFNISKLQQAQVPPNID